MIGTQAYLIASGNYAWLNLLTMVVTVSGGSRRAHSPALAEPRAGHPRSAAALVHGRRHRSDRRRHRAQLVADANLLGGRQLMNYSFTDFIWSTLTEPSAA